MGEMPEAAREYIIREGTIKEISLQLTSIIMQIEEAKKHLRSLEKQRNGRIVRLREYDVPLSRIAMLSELNRNRVKEIVESHYNRKEVLNSTDLNSSEALRQETIPENVQAALDDYSAKLKAEMQALEDQ